jgi:hypothetical protein
LNGTANPGGGSATAWFDWGTSSGSGAVPTSRQSRQEPLQFRLRSR